MHFGENVKSLVYLWNMNHEHITNNSPFHQNRVLPFLCNYLLVFLNALHNHRKNRKITCVNY